MIFLLAFVAAVVVPPLVLGIGLKKGKTIGVHRGRQDRRRGFEVVQRT